MAGSSVLKGDDGVMVVLTTSCCPRGENQAVTVLGPEFSGMLSRRMGGGVVPLWVTMVVRLDG
ncbi:hypothetical protein DVH24_013534 [Malus domestica]|uniref:Uncharacterized protein n=1 Tax=Malus domestica TaxID=3750 RepID=A0A498HH22_MALDO|nr:hypothetical protein DVH24_013531 [Malus domestica]RXH70788.1 hypothetical protein DVH24_013534 [Malus domestica]